MRLPDHLSRRAPTYEVSLGATPDRMALLGALGVVLGLVGGGAAFAVVRLVGLLSNLALLHRMGWNLPNLAHYHPGPALFGVALGGAAAVVALARWAPVIRGHGIPESLEAIVLRESRIQPRVLVAKPLSAAVAMGTGGPFGAEGPIIVTGGTIGSLIGQVLRVSAAERRTLLATGAAAGMAGVFGTPIAAIVLAFELLLFERSLRSLVPLMLATGTADELHRILLGTAPLFAAHGLLPVAGAQVPLFLVLGLACGLLAAVATRGLFAVEALFRRSPVPPAAWPLVGAVGFAGIGLAVPGSLSVGYWAIGDAVNGRFLAGAAALLLVAKLGSWWIALASETSGGTLAPLFLVGATAGELVGIGFAHAFPGLHVQPAAFALVAMGATFAASSRAVLTGAVFALEVTGAWVLVVPMVLAVAVAELVAERFLDDRLMTDKLVRRGFRVTFDAEVDPLRTAFAGQVMDPLPEGPPDPALPRVHTTDYLRQAVAIFLADGVSTVIVVEDGDTPVGVLHRSVVEAAVARRLAESAPQAPTLVPGRRPWRVARPGNANRGGAPDRAAQHGQSAPAAADTPAGRCEPRP
jgi:CIC family chloride channel protein